VKVHLTIEIDDDARRAMRLYHGQNGLATRAEVRNAIETVWDSVLVDIVNEAKALYDAPDA